MSFGPSHVEAFSINLRFHSHYKNLCVSDRAETHTTLTRAGDSGESNKKLPNFNFPSSSFRVSDIILPSLYHQLETRLVKRTVNRHI